MDELETCISMLQHTEERMQSQYRTCDDDRSREAIEAALQEIEETLGSLGLALMRAKDRAIEVPCDWKGRVLTPAVYLQPASNAALRGQRVDTTT